MLEYCADSLAAWFSKSDFTKFKLIEVLHVAVYKDDLYDNIKFIDLVQFQYEHTILLTTLISRI